MKNKYSDVLMFAARRYNTIDAVVYNAYYP